MPGRIVDVHSIWKRVRFHCIDELLADTFEFARAEPVTLSGGSETIDIMTMRDRNGFYDFTGEYAGQPGTTQHLLNRAHKILRDVMIAEVPDAPILHGASIVADGCRFILLADKSTGKTTSCLKYLTVGFRVEGDEHVVVLEADVIARARTLRIKQSSLGIVPELDTAIRASPFIKDWKGDLIYSMPPRTVDNEWRIEQGPAHCIVFLTGNHGGATMVRPMSSEMAFEQLLTMVYLPEVGRGAAIARLHRLSRQCRAVEMRIGDLGRAVWHLQQIATCCKKAPIKNSHRSSLYV